MEWINKLMDDLIYIVFMVYFDNNLMIYYWGFELYDL